MQLSKTDFIQYLKCPESLWIKKHEPDRYPLVESSVLLQKIVREGYEVEDQVALYFENAGIENVEFQKTLETDDGLLARADALVVAAEGRVTLYEVKSSTSIKNDPRYNHIKDACFQKICAERTGIVVDRVVLVHLNGHYVRSGAIDPSQLLVFADVTEQVSEIQDETSREVDSALEMLQQAELMNEGCGCLYKSRNKRV